MRPSIQRARSLAVYLGAVNAGKKLSSGDVKTRSAAALHGTCQDHFAAMVVLLMGSTPYNISAFALCRSVIDSHIRALWIETAATDEELERCFSDTSWQWPKTYRLIKRIEEAIGEHAIDGLKGISQRQMQVLHDYVHGGAEVILRWNGSNVLEPNFPNTDVDAVIDLAGRIALCATGHLAILMSNGDAPEAILKQGKTLLPL